MRDESLPLKVCDELSPPNETSVPLGTPGSEVHSRPPTTFAGWKGQPFPHSPDVELLKLPDGRILKDACVWRNFMQTQLEIDPDAIWKQLLQLPEWPDDKPIPFREDGSDPHWIHGSHPALNYRGNAVKRHKFWCQSGFGEGLRKYGYTGWQWKIAYATHDVQFVEPVRQVAEALNRGLSIPHNHWIVTMYEDEADNIGYHSDKVGDFREDSYFVVLKLGAARPFAFRVKGEEKPFSSAILPAGTAVFCRAKSKRGDDANSIVEHGVPTVEVPCGLSGSIVGRCINTLIPWDDVTRKVKARERRQGRKTPSKNSPSGRTSRTPAAKSDKSQSSRPRQTKRSTSPREVRNSMWPSPHSIKGLTLVQMQDIIRPHEQAGTHG